MGLSAAGAIALSSGIAAATSGAQMISGGKMNKRAVRDAREAREWQSREREAARRWQEQANRDYSQYLWDHFESPQAKMAAYKAANLNPDLMYSQGGIGSVSSNISSPSASVPVMPDYGFGNNAIQSGLQSLGNTAQQAVLNKAALDESKTRQDLNKSKSKESDSVTLLNGETIELTKEKTGFTREQRSQLASSIENINADTALKRQKVQESIAQTNFLSWSADEKRQAIQEMKDTFNDRWNTIKWQNRKLLVELDISKQDLEFLRKTLEDRIDMLGNEATLSYWDTIDANDYHQRQHYGKDSEGNTVLLGTAADIALKCMAAMTQGNAELLNTQLELLKDYGDAESVMRIVSGMLSAIGPAAIAAVLGRTYKTRRIAPGPYQRSSAGFAPQP